ncbi:hypothetical protein [Pasteuria penetrans]|uniref:hypothetical protein n=1 Tax=Pasteuria penetrans TaxID=86005 RepID=UPI0011EBE0CE|nr:hypothetical protein [Pasteuria penetrans]
MKSVRVSKRHSSSSPDCFPCPPCPPHHDDHHDRHDHRDHRKVDNCLCPPVPVIHLRGNDVQEECICVPKVYDWVVVPNDDRNKVLIPDPCRGEIESLLVEGVPIRVDVIQPPIPPKFPISCGPPAVQANISCSVIPPIRHIQIASPVNGRPIDVALVRFLFVVNATIVLTREDTDAEICRFEASTQLDDDIILCLPKPLDESNIRCRVIELSICPSGVIFDGLVELSVQLCKEIQVEADVKLEVMGRFCHPRPPIIPEFTPRCSCLPEMEFPKQCPDIFPRPDASCQGAVNSSDEGVNIQLPDKSTGSGSACINAEICSNCNPVSTNIFFRFTADSSCNNAQSFVFESQLLEALGCFSSISEIDAFIASLGLPPALFPIPGFTINPGSIALAAQGHGALSPIIGSAPLASYVLLLVQNACPAIPSPVTRDLYILLIGDTMNTLFAVAATVPGMNLEVRPCRQFS